MAETTPMLDWKKLLDPDHVPVLTEEPPPPVESEFGPGMAGAGFGAVLAVPVFLVVVAKFLPGNFSDNALVVCALAAPALGGAAGAIVAVVATSLYRKLARSDARKN